MIMERSMSQTTERLNLWSANDFVLARWGFVRFIALRCMFIWCFVSTCKSPSSNSVYKIPRKNYLNEIFDDCSLLSHWGFSIKNPTIESEVSWSSLLSFLHFRRTEFTTLARHNIHYNALYTGSNLQKSVLLTLIMEYHTVLGSLGGAGMLAGVSEVGMHKHSSHCSCSLPVEELNPSGCTIWLHHTK